MWKDSMQVRDKEDICGRKYVKHNSVPQWIRCQDLASVL